MIAPMLQEITDESGTSKRVDVDYSLTQIHVNMEAGMGDIFVDSLRTPKMLLAIGNGTSPTYKEKFSAIALMYIRKEYRAPERVEWLLEKAREYARGKGSDVIYWSRWDYNESNNSDEMWARNGFRKQETLFVQHLTD